MTLMKTYEWFENETYETYENLRMISTYKGCERLGTYENLWMIWNLKETYEWFESDTYGNLWMIWNL